MLQVRLLLLPLLLRSSRLLLLSHHVGKFLFAPLPRLLVLLTTVLLALHELVAYAVVLLRGVGKIGEPVVVPIDHYSP